MIQETENVTEHVTEHLEYKETPCLCMRPTRSVGEPTELLQYVIDLLGASTEQCAQSCHAAICVTKALALTCAAKNEFDDGLIEVGRVVRDNVTPELRKAIGSLWNNVPAFSWITLGLDEITRNAR